MKNLRYNTKTSIEDHISKFKALLSQSGMKESLSVVDYFRQTLPINLQRKIMLLDSPPDTLDNYKTGGQHLQENTKNAWTSTGKNWNQRWTEETMELLRKERSKCNGYRHYDNRTKSWSNEERPLFHMQKHGHLNKDCPDKKKKPEEKKEEKKMLYIILLSSFYRLSQHSDSAPNLTSLHTDYSSTCYTFRIYTYFRFQVFFYCSQLLHALLFTLPHASLFFPCAQTLFTTFSEFLWHCIFLWLIFVTLPTYPDAVYKLMYLPSSSSVCKLTLIPLLSYLLSKSPLSSQLSLFPLVALLILW